MPFHTTAQPSAATSPVISDLAISLYFCNIIAVIVSSAGDEPRVLYMLDKCTLPMPQPLSTLNSRDLICYIFLALCLLSSLFWGLHELREYLAFLMLSSWPQNNIWHVDNFYSCKYLFIFNILYYSVYECQVPMCTCVCAGMLFRVCVWRPKFNSRCLFLLLSILSLETGSLLNCNSPFCLECQ